MVRDLLNFVHVPEGRRSLVLLHVVCFKWAGHPLIHVTLELGGELNMLTKVRAS